MRITILLDNPGSWLVPFAQQLEDELQQRGHQVGRICKASDLPEGEVAFFLACERIVPADLLKRHQHNLVVHESALPQGKGWSPLTWQIIEGAAKVPITLFEAAEAVDAGDIYFQEELEFAGGEASADMEGGEG